MVLPEKIALLILPRRDRVVRRSRSGFFRGGEWTTSRRKRRPSRVVERHRERILIARRFQRRLRRVRRVTIGVCDWFTGWRTGVFGVITKRQRVYVDSYWFGCVRGW